MELVMIVLGWAEKGIMGLLVLLSMWSIGIMIERRRVFKAYVRKDDFANAENLILKNDRAALLQTVSAPGLFKNLVTCLAQNPFQTSESVEPEYKNVLYKERRVLEKNLSVLATLGANTPFIGLLGTVFGIIQAFSQLSNQQGASNAVMSSIASALIATALGLFVAIPAVVAYNYFSLQLKSAMGSAEALKNLYISRLPSLRK